MTKKLPKETAFRKKVRLLCREIGITKMQFARVMSIRWFLLQSWERSGDPKFTEFQVEAFQFLEGLKASPTRAGKFTCALRISGALAAFRAGAA